MDNEQIGNVILDLSYYSGSDLYCDGASEDRILAIAKDTPEEEFDRVIRKEKDWPTLYHLSSIRGNIVSWIPFGGSEKVLEIGAGPGAVTGVLSQRCAQVDCVELSRKRSMINAYRHRNRTNIAIRVGNFEDIEPHLDRDYDYVFLIGVLEYAKSYLSGADPFREELRRVRSHLRPGGRIVIAIENRFGLKYWAGCAEDHSGRYFDGIESYPSGESPAITFTRPALERMLREIGACEYSFYYPYPDYKFTSTLYSDRRLPEASELSENIRNYDRERLLLFDEQKAYRGITEDGLYPLFANSYEIVLGPELPVVYCKFSNDRAPQYRIRTQIELQAGPSGMQRPIVTKYPMTAAASSHVARLEESCRRLKERYEGEGVSLHIAPCVRTADGGVSFPYISGRSLEELLDDCLDRGDGERFLALLDEYLARAGSGGQQQIADFDMTFSNILIDGETWTAVDYEWAVEERLPAREQLFRSLLVYYLEDESRSLRCEKLIGQEVLLSRFGMPQEEANRLAMEEQGFQNQVTEGVTSLGELRSQMGTGVIKPAQLQTQEEIEEHQRELEQQRQEEEQTLSSVQVYFDSGEGYREEESLWIEEHYGEEGRITFCVEVPAKVQSLRVDPAICPCVVMLREVVIEGKDCTERAGRLIRTDGRQYANGSIVYTTSDPWMEWKVKPLLRAAGEPEGEAFQIELTIQMAGLPSTMAEEMEHRSGKKLFH